MATQEKEITQSSADDVQQQESLQEQSHVDQENHEDQENKENGTQSGVLEEQTHIEKPPKKIKNEMLNFLSLLKKVEEAKVRKEQIAKSPEQINQQKEYQKVILEEEFEGDKGNSEDDLKIHKIRNKHQKAIDSDVHSNANTLSQLLVKEESVHEVEKSKDQQGNSLRQEQVALNQGSSVESAQNAQNYFEKQSDNNFITPVEVLNDSNLLPKEEEHSSKDERNHSSRDQNEIQTKEGIAVLDYDTNSQRISNNQSERGQSQTKESNVVASHPNQTQRQPEKTEDIGDIVIAHINQITQDQQKYGRKQSEDSICSAWSPEARDKGLNDVGGNNHFQSSHSMDDLQQLISYEEYDQHNLSRSTQEHKIQDEEENYSSNNNNKNNKVNSSQQQNEQFQQQQQHQLQFLKPQSQAQSSYSNTDRFSNKSAVISNQNVMGHQKGTKSESDNGMQGIDVSWTQRDQAQLIETTVQLIKEEIKNESKLKCVLDNLKSIQCCLKQGFEELGRRKAEEKLSHLEYQNDLLVKTQKFSKQQIAQLQQQNNQILGEYDYIQRELQKMRELEKELKHSLDEAKKMNRNFSEMLRAKTEESRSKEAATRSIGESLRRLGLHVQSYQQFSAQMTSSLKLTVMQVLEALISEKDQAQASAIAHIFSNIPGNSSNSYRGNGGFSLETTHHQHHNNNYNTFNDYNEQVSSEASFLRILTQPQETSCGSSGVKQEFISMKESQKIDNSRRKPTIQTEMCNTTGTGQSSTGKRRSSTSPLAASLKPHSFSSIQSTKNSTGPGSKQSKAIKDVYRSFLNTRK